MTIKEATLKSLEDLGRATSSAELYNEIIKRKYYDFKDSKTPASTISAILGDFIRNGDTRVKDVRRKNFAVLLNSLYLHKN